MLYNNCTIVGVENLTMLTFWLTFKKIKRFMSSIGTSKLELAAVIWKHYWGALVQIQTNTWNKSNHKKITEHTHLLFASNWKHSSFKSQKYEIV